MLFSYCVPIRNRAEDFKEVLPTILAAARNSPPVEIVVLDYGSTDCLRSYLAPYYGEIKYRFHDAPYFHMAHARNLAMGEGRGEYLISSNADTLLDPEFFESIRRIISYAGAQLIRPNGVNGVFAVEKKEFEAAGGFDERFEFYGPEDKDIIQRFKRRGLREAFFARDRIAYIHTPDDKKVANYRGGLSKREMSKRMRPIFEQNKIEGRLTANDT